ncbi:MAG: sigma-70 domain-containing protein, partial [Candidatus Binataceae bacterium]
IRIPVHMFETTNKLLRVTRLLVQRLGREPTLDEIAGQLTAAAEEWAQLLQLVASGLGKFTSMVDKIRRPILFAALAARLDALNRIYVALVSWFNNATAIGLLPPSYAVDPDPDGPKCRRLDAASRELLKRIEAELEAELSSPQCPQHELYKSLKQLEAEAEAKAASSESEAGQQNASLNAIAKTIVPNTIPLCQHD